MKRSLREAVGVLILRVVGRVVLLVIGYGSIVLDTPSRNALVLVRFPSGGRP